MFQLKSIVFLLLRCCALEDNYLFTELSRARPEWNCAPLGNEYFDDVHVHVGKLLE